MYLMVVTEQFPNI